MLIFNYIGSKNLEEAKREYNSAPRALTAEEAAAVASFERAKEHAEAQRRQRLAFNLLHCRVLYRSYQGGSDSPQFAWV
jgi:hypothetical protein